MRLFQKRIRPNLKYATGATYKKLPMKPKLQKMEINWTIIQQQEYVDILRKMYGKVLRLCGEGSRQEKSFLDILVKETEILDEMESQ